MVFHLSQYPQDIVNIIITMIVIALLRFSNIYYFSRFGLVYSYTRSMLSTIDLQ